MKKKSVSRSAFFNLRVLIGLCVILAGACLALFGFANPFGRGTTAPATGKTKQSQPSITMNTLLNLKVLPAGFDCCESSPTGYRQARQLLAGLIMIACGYTEGGSEEGTEEGLASLRQRVLPMGAKPVAGAVVYRRR